MKKAIIFCLSLAALCLAVASCQKTKSITYPDPIEYTGDIETSEVVDLGLSVDWASKNVGALRAEEFGDYYSWGDTKTAQSVINIANYWDFNTETRAYVKYNTSSMILESADDVASVKFAGNFRIPSPAEVQELFDKCTWIYASYKGVVGYVVSSNVNGKSIFFPCAGYGAEKGYVNAGKSGLYWTNISAAIQGSGSDLAAFAKAFSMWPDRLDCADAHKYLACPIRPVADITTP